MDPIEAIDRATAHAAKVVAGVRSDQLSNTTPCQLLDLRGLLNHMLANLEMFRGAAATGTGTMPEGDQVGDDPGAEYARRRDALLEAWRGPGVLERTLALPFGSMPGQMVAGIAFMEHLIHAWDVAKATGQDPTLPEDLATACLEQFKPAGDMLRSPGVFGPEVEVAENAPITDRLVAFAGRTP